jgi:hypothetical protein
MARSQRVQGSPLYDNPYDNPHVVANLDPQPDLTIQAYWQDVFKQQLSTSLFQSYWGLFGWLDTEMPRWTYQALSSMWRLALFGVGVSCVVALRRRPADWDTLWVLIVLTVLSFSLLLPMFGRGYIIARDTGITGSSAHGRYLLGLWTAQATALVFGLTAVVTEPAEKLVHGLISWFFVALNIVAFVAAIIPRYYL